MEGLLSPRQFIKCYENLFIKNLWHQSPGKIEEFLIIPRAS